tara:strand:- start:5618 stop:6205 length:588 start_codon:yes stop_codon:yes gene_type:complete
MKLSEYVEHLDNKNFDYYQDTLQYANYDLPGYTFVKNVSVPSLDFIKKITNSNRSDHKDVTYTLGKHELLDTWATTQFPNLMYKQTYAQLQKPGEQVLPHVDTLHSQIKNWINEDPSLANIEHSMEHPNPNFKAVRYFIAVEDNIDGQDFILNNKKWIWKKGDCIKLNVWTTEHHTANNSHVDRYMLKITAIENR